MCILLVKMLNDENSRFYLDYVSEHDALLGKICTGSRVGIMELYEQMLRQKNPDKTTLTYSLADVLAFVDRVSEIVLLQYDKAIKGFRPHARSWIKARLTESIKSK